MMKNFEYDLDYIQASLDSLKDYLLSEEMFWPLSAQPPAGATAYPRLTLGGMLLSARRLSAYRKSSNQAEQMNQVDAQLNMIRSKWRVAWEKKASHNFSTRLRMWRDFIEEYRSNPQENADRYAYEVRLRVMLNLLQAETRDVTSAEVDLLLALDKFLKNTLVAGKFVWEEELQAGFPATEYWYLYGILPAGVKMY